MLRSCRVISLSENDFLLKVVIGDDITDYYLIDLKEMSVNKIAPENLRKLM